MKRASKILTILLVAVFLLTALTGCAMFGRNTDKYRNTVAFTVGEVDVTLGKLLDTFNQYYNTYASYIGQGITVDTLFELTMNDLRTEAIKIDAYISNSAVEYDHGYDYKYAEFLSADEMAFAISYVKYSMYKNLDATVEGYIKDEFELDPAETEDTSRDFAELDKMDMPTYAEQVYSSNFQNEDMDEYIQKYRANEDFTQLVISYVYTNVEDAQAIVDEINERIVQDEDSDETLSITAEDYIAWQQKAFNQYVRNMELSYEAKMEKVLEDQISGIITSVLVAKYNLSVNVKLEGENLQQTLDALQSKYQALRDQHEAQMALNDTFVDYIEGLTADSYIYSIPEKYQGEYIFVKNILIPFTDEQKAQLNNLASDLGGDTTVAFKEQRTLIAQEIVAEDFLNKDAEGENQKVENIFAVENGKLVVNQAGALGQYLKADGSVVAMDGKTVEETFVELMKQYNTDTAQHTATYDYVVRTGYPANYTAKWVEEFVDGANEAKNLANAAGKNGGYYALAISTYGVHIVYYTKDVEAQTFNFTAENIYNPATVEYRFFKTYFSQQSSLQLNNEFEELEKSYQDKISKTGEFDKFLAENEITFDFEDFITIEDEDAE